MSIVPRQKKNESDWNYRERCSLHFKTFKMSNITDIDMYKSFLEKELIDYVEFTHEKENGNKVHIVIPSCQFKVMTKADINKLFKI